VRIAYVGPLPPIPGGIAHHGAKLVRALRGQGHEVSAVSWRSQYPPLLYRGSRRAPGAVADPDCRYLLRWWSPLSWWRAGRWVRGSDVVVFPWVTPFHAVPLRVLLGVAGGRRVAFVHNPVPHERMPFARLLTRWVLGCVDGVLTHGRVNQGEIEKLFGLRRVVAVFHPPNLDLEPTPLPPAPPFRLLFIGYVRPYKGLDVAVEAVSRLVGEGLDVHLTVAGEFWEDPAEWSDRIAGLGLGDHVDLCPGYVTDDELVRLLGDHHILVAPYRSATASGVVPLAFAAGRPVVATDVGALSERVIEGETGALAPPGDPGAFADAVRRVIDQMGPMAERVPAAAGSWDDMAAALVAMVDEAAGVRVLLPDRGMGPLRRPLVLARTLATDWYLNRGRARRVGRRPLRSRVAGRVREPVFVVGSPRSGTTFLGECLGAMPVISYHHEPVATKAAAAFVELGVWHEERASRFFRKVYRCLLRLRLDGGLRYVDKTPRNVFLMPFLSRAFPDARFIHIVRDGRDVALSWSERPWFRDDAPKGYEPGGYRYGPRPAMWVEPDRIEEFLQTTTAHRCAWGWRRFVEAGLAGSEALGDAVLQVRYERLMADPDGEGERILDFLGIGHEASRRAFLEALGNADPSSVGRWRAVPDLGDEARAEMADLLKRLGYEA
jgi:glycosyltransferase involved in cell wall biosynthesis